MQPFTLWIFERGPPPGPHLIMEKLRGNLTTDETMAAYHKALELNGDLDEGGPKAGSRLGPMKQTYRCMHCFLAGKPCMEESKAFGVRKPSELRQRLCVKNNI